MIQALILFLTIFNFIEYYKISNTERWADPTTLVTNNKLTTTDSLTSMFYHTSERKLFTASAKLTPIPNRESFPSVIFVVSMGCLISTIFYLTSSECLLYRKHRRFSEYIEENRYLSCALKHTKV